MKLAHVTYECEVKIASQNNPRCIRNGEPELRRVEGPPVLRYSRNSRNLIDLCTSVGIQGTGLVHGNTSTIFQDFPKHPGLRNCATRAATNASLTPTNHPNMGTVGPLSSDNRSCERPTTCPRSDANCCKYCDAVVGVEVLLRVMKDVREVVRYFP